MQQLDLGQMSLQGFGERARQHGHTILRSFAITPMQGQNAKIIKTFLVVVNSAIVYQSIGFSHSLVRGLARDLVQTFSMPPRTPAIFG